MSLPTSDITRCLEVGRAVVVQPVSAGPAGNWRLQGFVRGWQEGRYVLLDARDDNVPTFIRSEMSCAVRFLYQGTACGFRAAIIDMGPGTFIRVTWPAEMSFAQIRRHERMEVEIPCLAGVEGCKPVQAAITDLSLGGCRVELPQEVNKDDVLVLSATLPDASNIAGLRATVRNVVSVGDLHAAGCVFNPNQDEVLQDLKFYVTTTLERQRGQAPSRPRVLIMERNATVGRYLQDWFEKRGCEGLVCADAVDGVFLMRMSPPRAVLVNVTDRDVFGIETCRMLKKSRRFEGLTLLAYGDASEGARARALEAGASNYISAGDDVRRISAAIAEYLPIELTSSSPARERSPLMDPLAAVSLAGERPAE